MQRWHEARVQKNHTSLIIIGRRAALVSELEVSLSLLSNVYTLFVQPQTDTTQCCTDDTGFVQTETDWNACRKGYTHNSLLCRYSIPEDSFHTWYGIAKSTSQVNTTYRYFLHHLALFHSNKPGIHRHVSRQFHSLCMQCNHLDHHWELFHSGTLCNHYFQLWQTRRFYRQ